MESMRTYCPNCNSCIGVGEEVDSYYTSVLCIKCKCVWRYETPDLVMTNNRVSEVTHGKRQQGCSAEANTQQD
jgi:transcription initiation factor TFIIIB Brf1 subunit/transcription initiation factor TFIIB